MENKPKTTKKKKVVVTTKQKTAVPTSTPVKKKVKATTANRVKSSPRTKKEAVEFVFGRENYIWMAAGFALVLLGMLLMLGGEMPSADVWDDNIIYSFRRTVLAPIMILAGLIVEIFAIFKGYNLKE